MADNDVDANVDWVKAMEEQEQRQLREKVKYACTH